MVFMTMPSEFVRLTVECVYCNQKIRPHLITSQVLDFFGSSLKARTSPDSRRRGQNIA